MSFIFKLVLAYALSPKPSFNCWELLFMDFKQRKNYALHSPFRLVSFLFPQFPVLSTNVYFPST